MWTVYFNTSEHEKMQTRAESDTQKITHTATYNNAYGTYTVRNCVFIHIAMGVYWIDPWTIYQTNTNNIIKSLIWCVG